MTNTVIALDIGHSAVKALATSKGETHRFFIPSVVCPAIAISDDAEAKRAEAETVTIHPGMNGTFFFGETALTQGAATLTGLSENWISTREHTALFLGAMQKIKAAVKFTDEPDLVVGLPTSLFQNQREEIEALVRKYFPAIGSIKVIPQAMGPLYGLMLDENGIPSREHAPTESWGVIEIGYFSSDFMMTKRGRWAENASDICSGVRLAAEHIKRLMGDRNITMSLSEAEDVLQTGRVKSFGQWIDAQDMVNEAKALVVGEVLDTANRLMENYVRQLDGVLVAGGGGALVIDEIKKQWPHAILVEDARFSVAEGMRRLGMARAIKRQAEEAKAN